MSRDLPRLDLSIPFQCAVFLPIDSTLQVSLFLKLHTNTTAIPIILCSRFYLPANSLFRQSYYFTAPATTPPIICF